MNKNGRPFLTKEPRLLPNDNNAGKPEGIHLMIGRRPYAAFGNSTGDQQRSHHELIGAENRRRRRLTSAPTQGKGCTTAAPPPDFGGSLNSD
jgi:hypothetical protein